MDRNSVLAAVAFATLAAVFVTLGFQGQERRAEFQAQQAAGLLPESEGSGFEGISPEAQGIVRISAWLLAVGSYLWILGAAFSEGLGWGLAVIFGNLLGAIAFTIFHPRQSAFPMFVLCACLGLRMATRLVGA